MNNTISVFSCLDSMPKKSVTWQETLKNIQSDKYKKFVIAGRKIQDEDEYREYKKRLPCVTFSGEFKKRNKEQIKAATGFIIPDIDKLTDVEKIFKLLIHDEYIWFAFRSPSGNGIKCGIRADNILIDEDIKKFYSAVERYFKEVYGITIDPSCKDICRLTFVSYDPGLWINPDPVLFNITAWKPTKKPPKIIPLPKNCNNGWKEKYGLKVLSSCCLEIQNSSKGTQHWIRLQKARLIGGYIAGGYIDETIALSQLENAVNLSGAKIMPQAMKTIKDGIDNGKLSPIIIEPKANNLTNYKNNKDIEYYCDPLEGAGNVGNVGKADTCRHLQTKADKLENMQTFADKSGQMRTLADTDETQKDGDAPQNLAAHILEYIKNSTGSFMTRDIDNEFCLTSRTEKKNRSLCLNRYIDKRLVKRDKKIKGKYHILDTSTDWIDLDAIEETSYPILFPFDIHKIVKIPQRAIVIIAGSSNAGKTSFILNMIRLNFQQKFRQVYLMSEMGGGEFKDRILGFGDPIYKWKQVLVASKSYDFESTIQHHNQDGVTYIDYLEDIDGEYFKIPSQIREIYDALNNGVAVVAIQKKKSQEFARGGEGTMEKARLYITLDYLCSQDHSIICAVKLTKIKKYVGVNKQDHELHFRITKGSHIETLMDWTPSHKVDRTRCIVEYERGFAFPDSSSDEIDPIHFNPVGEKSKPFRIREETIVKWGANYTNIEDIYDEVLKISQKHIKKPFVKNFVHLANLMAKINKDQEEN